MKNLILFALRSIGVVSTSHAADCPDISGVYQATEKLLVRFQQLGCTELLKSTAVLRDDGRPLEWVDLKTLSLDGIPTCSSPTYCEAATANPDKIVFHSNAFGPILTTDHGHCTQNGYDAIKDSKGNLIAKFHVTACEDRYEGASTKIFPRY